MLSMTVVTRYSTRPLRSPCSSTVSVLFWHDPGWCDFLRVDDGRGEGVEPAAGDFHRRVAAVVTWARGAGNSCAAGTKKQCGDGHEAGRYGMRS